jgi:ketosteroid isomerase-like protein
MPMTHAEIDALADRIFAAIEAGDVDTVRAIYADDVTVWHNFDLVDQTKDQNLRTLGWMHAHAHGLRYTDVRRIVLDHGFVQQHVLRATAANGTEMAIPAMLHVHCADGAITRIEEYLDPAQAAAMRA